jgi:hypothetical protein
MMRSPSPFQGGPQTPAEHALLEALNDPTIPMWEHATIESALLAEPSDAAFRLQRMADLFQARAEELYGNLPDVDNAREQHH